MNGWRNVGAITSPQSHLWLLATHSSCLSICGSEDLHLEGRRWNIKVFRLHLPLTCPGQHQTGEREVRLSHQGPSTSACAGVDGPSTRDCSWSFRTSP